MIFHYPYSKLLKVRHCDMYVTPPLTSKSYFKFQISIYICCGSKALTISCRLYRIHIASRGRSSLIPRFSSRIGIPCVPLHTVHPSLQLPTLHSRTWCVSWVAWPRSTVCWPCICTVFTGDWTCIPWSTWWIYRKTCHG